MTLRLSARLERLRPSKIDGFVVYYDPGESDLEVELKALTAGRSVILAPRPCRDTQEWLLTCAPFRGSRA